MALVLGIFFLSLVVIADVGSESEIIKLNSNSNVIELNQVESVNNVLGSENNKEVKINKKGNVSIMNPYCQPSFCNSDNYESNEGPGTGSCCPGSDEAGYEECTEYFTKSIAHTYWDEQADYCENSYLLKEAYIDCNLFDDAIHFQDKDCDDYDWYGSWVYYCTSNQVRKKHVFYNYGCSDGACKLISSNWVDDTLVSDRGWSDYCAKRKEGVNNGWSGCSLCVRGDWDCDSDSECAGSLVCKGPLILYDDGCCNSNERWDYNLHECCECSASDGPCCDGCHYKTSSYVCNSHYGNYYYFCNDGQCLGNDVFKKDKSQYCSGSSSQCTGRTEWNSPLIYDYCGSSEFCDSDFTGYNAFSCSLAQCTSGVCCDTTCGAYTFKPTTTKCSETTEYGCPWGTGCDNNVGKRTRSQYCSGSTSGCDGSVQYSGWSVSNDCNRYQKCSSSEGYSCQWNRGCLPACDSTSCSSCSSACSVSTSKINMCGTEQYYKKTISSSYVSCDLNWTIIADPEAELKLYAKSDGNCPYVINWDCKNTGTPRIDGKMIYECYYPNLAPGTYYALAFLTGLGVYDVYANLRNCQSPPCSCTSWQNVGCGLGGCPANQMQQTRTCTPAGCDVESRCIDDASCNIRCYQNSDCGTDGWVGNPVCSADDVFQNWRTNICNNPGTPQASCSYTDELRLKQDCGNDYCDNWGSNYCKDNDVYHSRTCHDKGCSNGACFDNSYTEEQKVQECGTAGCSNGQCNIACYQDSDCGNPHWKNIPFCSNDDVFDYWVTPKCANPGQTNAYCYNQENLQLKQDCGNDYCGNWGGNYCRGNNVYHSRTCHDLGCSNANCFNNPYADEQFVQDCSQLGGWINLENETATVPAYDVYIGKNYYSGQTFKFSQEVYAYKACIYGKASSVWASDYDINLEIYDVATRGRLAWTIISDIPTSYSVLCASFTNPIRLDSGKQYALVVSSPLAPSTSTHKIRRSGDTNPYSQGGYIYSTNYGVGWSYKTSQDLVFRVEGGRQEVYICSNGNCVIS